MNLTNKCNLNCVHCAFSSGSTQQDELYYGRLCDFIEEAMELGLEDVHLTGGEPLLYEQLTNLLSYLNQTKLTVRSITNGLTLSKKLLKKYQDLGLKSIMISIDGMEEMHNRIRGGNPNAFKKSVGAVIAAKQLGYHVRVNAVVTKANLNEMLDLILLCRDLGVDVFSFFLYSPTGRNAEKQLNTAIEEAGKREQSLKEEINTLNNQLGKLQTALTDAQRKASEAIAQQNNWRDINTKFLATNDELRKLLEDKLAQLKDVDAKRIQGDKQLKETTATLIEKMAIIDDLQKQTNLLLEEKTDLQNKLGNLLQPTGQAVAPPVSVTALKETARVAVPAVDIGLNGLVTKVDLENSLAQISIGAANGVKQNMKFHVTRADKFICDIVILDVEPEKAVGTLELMDVTKEQPKAGDNVSTNL